MVREAFLAAGTPADPVVASQAEPDPMFPTVAFPNPEEPGAIDLALERSRSRPHADVVIANDPDADRCAVGRPRARWLADAARRRGRCAAAAHVLSRGRGGVVPDSPECVFANSIVSSRLLGGCAGRRGVRHEETLTGFKWIGRVPGLRYGYEEALGYCVDPGRVRDKDGISAALLVAELVASLQAEGRSLVDRLDDLAHGSTGCTPPTPSRCGSRTSRSSAGSWTGCGPAPPSDGGAGRRGGRRPGSRRRRPAPDRGPALLLADDSRVIVRPSGTEPKLKVYLEVVEPVTGDDLRGARDRAAPAAGRHPRRPRGGHRALSPVPTAGCPVGRGYTRVRSGLPVRHLGRGRPPAAPVDSTGEHHVSPSERQDLLGVSRLTNSALGSWLHGLPGVDQVGCEERAAVPRHPLDQDHEQGLGDRHRHLDDRPHDPGGG